MLGPSPDLYCVVCDVAYAYDDEHEGCMSTEQISLGIANQELGNHSLTQARQLVELGECRWVRARSATLKLVPMNYQLGLDEQFIEERADGTWGPERKT